MEIIELAIKYGGYTALDRVYLEQLLAGKSQEEALRWITPPPSVVNAYFAEIYQKQSAQAALDYFFELSQAFDLFNAAPSFVEEKPFIRLNLLGQSFGLCFENKAGDLLVFSELDTALTDEIIVELCQVFQGYDVWQDGKQLRMKVLEWDEQNPKVLEASTALTDVVQFENGDVKVSGFNLDEVLEQSNPFAGKAYYRFEQRQIIIRKVQSV